MEEIEERASEYAHTEWIDEFTYAAKESYIKGAIEQKSIDDERIAELEKEKALLILEVHNKNKLIAELKAIDDAELLKSS